MLPAFCMPRGTVQACRCRRAKNQKNTVSDFGHRTTRYMMPEREVICILGRDVKGQGKAGKKQAKNGRKIGFDILEHPLEK